MRTLVIWRIIALLLLASGMFIAPQLDIYVPGAVAAKDEEKSEKNKNDNDEDDGDEDDEGNGKKDNDKKKNKNKDKSRGKDKKTGVDPAAQYAVEVQCEPHVDGSSTTCSFTGIPPADGKDLGYVVLPQEEACAEVIGGQFEYVDPDPNTRVTGYKSQGDEGMLILVLGGEVTPAGAATYWFKTGVGTFPATGPGLSCEESPADFVLNATNEAVDGTAVATNATGSLMADIYSCTDVPEDTTNFDWFGACDPEGGVHEFTLAEVRGAAEPRTSESDASGDVVFESLAPGSYSLEIIDTMWCHAVSDSVTAEGKVVVEAGKRATVWGFICEAETPK